MPIVDLKDYNTEGNEAHYVQINQLIGVFTKGKKVSEETINQAEMDFMLDLKSMIAKSNQQQTPTKPSQICQQTGVDIHKRQNCNTIRTPEEIARHFGHGDTTKRAVEAKSVWWPNINRDIEEKVKTCIARLASGKNLKNQITINKSGKLKPLTKLGQEVQIEFTGKLHNQKINGENELLIAIDRFSKLSTVTNCKTCQTKGVIRFLVQNFNLYGIPEKIKPNKGGALVSKEYIDFCKSKNIEVEDCSPRIHTSSVAVERAIQTIRHLIVANLEDNLCLTESVNRAIQVMRFAIHTGLESTPFELHHGRKPRIKFTNLVEDGKSYLPDWSELSVSAEKKLKIPIYLSRGADGDVINYLVMPKIKAEKSGRQTTEK